MADSGNGGASSSNYNDDRDLADVTSDETIDMDYEPTSEDSDERITVNEAFLERLLAGQEEEEGEDDDPASEIGEADDNGINPISSLIYTHLLNLSKATPR